MKTFAEDDAEKEAINNDETQSDNTDDFTEEEEPAEIYDGFDRNWRKRSRA